MKLKTFTAPDMAAALRLIKNDLGRDAVILSTRKVKTPEGKTTLEITAALERSTSTTDAETIEISPTPIMAPSNGSTAAPSNLMEALREHSILPEYSEKLSKATHGVVEAGFSPTDALEMVMSKMISFKAPADLFPRGQAHVVVGPTGAGKTTFLCKLAVDRQRSGASIGLMSLDDQKIAGFEPLNIVGDALGEQAHLIRSTEDLATAAKSLGKRHYLLIDTPGLNPRKPREIIEFKERLDGLGLPTTVHLVLPANLNETDMAALPYAFRHLNPSSLVFTKLDETTRLGPIASVMMAQKLPCGLVSDSNAIQSGPCELTAPLLAQQLTTPPKPIWEVDA
ncbi:MAG: hypothetical protein OXR68_03210 [Alphaproteobacteria bacterium]|nr:hypothetical protein [Alphaproteobacteria bacterium]MDD9919614.1 hypothetical protein [Alphaproteobacteria bacterium]